MNLLNKLNKKIKTRFFNKIDKAVDQIKYGLYARINNEVSQEGEKEPGLFAAAVVNELFSLPPKTNEAELFLKENKNRINAYINRIKNDDDKQNAITQALKVRHLVVFNALGSGGSDDFARIPLQNMEKKGIVPVRTDILPPEKFIKFAKKYIQTSPEY